ncbi:MAG TPA: chorismate mutase [Terriglobia bacterium]|jgi:chorismate mutase|nr:chorismate mutase [Terriglobia bacterium]
MDDLARWRSRIDEIDELMCKLLNERAQCAVEIGYLKRKLNQPAWQPEREREILRHVVQSNSGPLDDAAIRRLFERIIDEARSLEHHVMSEPDLKPQPDAGAPGKGKE